MIFGEPTNNEMLVGSKGLLEYELSFQGQGLPGRYQALWPAPSA